MQNTNTLSVALQIQNWKIWDEEQNLVNARDLHTFLESKQDFSNWIKNRMEKYWFEENEDFSIILLKSNWGRPRKEVFLTLDTAKEISMVENNEKGREARKYFLQIEKAYREENKLKLPQTYWEALRQLVETVENNEKMELVIKEMQPKALLADTFLNHWKDEITFTDWAHWLWDWLWRNTVFKILKQKGYLCQNNSPKQTQINNWNFTVIYSVYEKNWIEHDYTKTLITKKWMQFFIKEKLLKWKEELPKTTREAKRMSESLYKKIINKFN